VNIRGESYRLKERRKAGLLPAWEGEEGRALSVAPASTPPKTRQKAALGSVPAGATESGL